MGVARCPIPIFLVSFGLSLSFSLRVCTRAGLQKMSSLDDLESPWGQLVNLDTGGDEDAEIIPIVGDKFTIGRGKAADLMIANNALVSTMHCVLMKGEGRVGVVIKDTSTNGTLLNGKKMVKGEEVRLAHGDVIRVVFNKNKPNLNVAYKFEDLLQPPAEEREDGGETSDATLTYEQEDDGELTIDYEQEESVKEEANVEEKATTVHPGPAEMDKEATASKKRKLEDSSDPPPSAKRTLSCAKKKEEEPEQVKGQGDLEQQGKDGKKAVDESSVSVSVKSADGDTSTAAVAKPTLEKKDSMEENLICQICQEILHDCVSLLPCMHSYCAGCYSEWMDHSEGNSCPACRIRVECIRKNHIVNNLIEAYLRANPEKKRSEEDLKELDAKNKITKDMLYPKRSRRHYDYEYSEEESTGSSSSSRSPSPSHHTLFPVPIPAHPFGFGGLPVLPTPAPASLCRQCPSYVGTPPTTSRIPPPFTCTPSSNHVLCMCCFQPMPDRRHDSDVAIPPQKCDICGKAFCHMYWGCVKFGCRGCLNLFKEMDFDSSCLTSILNNGNMYESRVLKDYLESKGLSIRDLLDTCCRKLDEGTYHCTDSRSSRMSSSTRTCYSCAMKNFKDLVYLYRKDIPSDELPGDVTSRPDCWYGRECRTQLNKPAHAQKFNHICEKIR